MRCRVFHILIARLMSPYLNNFPLVLSSLPEPVPPRRGSLISRHEEHNDREDGDIRMMKLKHNVSQSQTITERPGEREVRCQQLLACV